ncbi:MAG TPA: hypothetical protein VEY08_02985, partial [Chloroflexia bacterium]|nr:hypothetical protein [Chloroflexia bacterium]
LLVVEERDQERLTHAGYAYEARLLGFVDASGESIPGDALSGASAVLITLSRDEKDVRTAEFAAGLASSSAIHILPASTISTSTPELTPKE